MVCGDHYAGCRAAGVDHDVIAVDLAIEDLRTLVVVVLGEWVGDGRATGVRGGAYINPRNMSTVRLMGGLLHPPHVNALLLSSCDVFF